jgi:hypothetical protein
LIEAAICDECSHTNHYSGQHAAYNRHYDQGICQFSHRIVLVSETCSK